MNSTIQTSKNVPSSYVLLSNVAINSHQPHQVKDAHPRILYSKLEPGDMAPAPIANQMPLHEGNNFVLVEDTNGSNSLLSMSQFHGMDATPILFRNVPEPQPTFLVPPRPVSPTGSLKIEGFVEQVIQAQRQSRVPRRRGRLRKKPIVDLDASSCSSSTVPNTPSVEPELSTCGICHISFPSTTLLLEHMRRHENERTFRCDYCLESFNQEVNAQVHVALFHRFPEHEMVCCLCKRAFNDQPRLMAHLNAHRVDDQLACHVCHRKFPSHSILQQHYITVHGAVATTNNQPVKMEMVSSGHQPMLSRPIGLSNRFMHLLKTEPVDETVATCFICMQSFSTEKSFKAHMSEHETQRPFPCPLCTDGTGFNHADNLTIHTLLNHSNLDSGSFACPFCQDQTANNQVNKFTRRSKFVYHLKKHQLDEVFPCARCGELQLTAELLHHHLQEHEHGCVVRPHRSMEHLHQPSVKFPPLTGEMKHEKRKKEAFVLLQKANLISQSVETPSTSTKLKIIEKVPSTLEIKYTQVNSKTFRCDECRSVFKKMSLLKRHSYHHSGAKPFQCPVCEKCFTQKKSAEVHLLTHDTAQKSKTTFKCDLCGKEFGYHTNCMVHVKSHFNSQRKASSECSRCGVFLKRSEMAGHMRLRHQDVEHDEGDDEFDNYTTKRVKKKTVRFKKQSKTTKKSTKKVTVVEVADEEGQEVYQGVMEKSPKITTWACSMCPRHLKSRFEFIHHMRIHRRVRPFACTFCSATFTLAAGLQSHLRLHAIGNEAPVRPEWSCAVCGKVVHSQVAHRLHMRRHTQERPHECRMCEKRFVSRTHRAYHERTAHDHHSGDMQPIPVSHNMTKEPSTNSLAHPCSQCDRTYKFKCHLKEHVRRVHEGEKRHACIYCLVAFANKSSLQRHIVACHLRVRQFACVTCGRRFATKADVSRHEATVHYLQSTNNTAFQCPQCEKIFRSKALCRAHILTHVKLPTEEKQQPQPPPPVLVEHSEVVTENVMTQNKETPWDELSYAYPERVVVESFTDLIQEESLVQDVVNHPPAGVEGEPTLLLTPQIHQQPHIPNTKTTRGFVEEMEDFLDGGTSFQETEEQDQFMETDYPLAPEPSAEHQPEAPQLHVSLPRLMFGCGKCEASFEQRNDLQSHFRFTHTPAVMTYRCAFCAFHADRIEVVLQHTHSHNHTLLASHLHCPLCPDREEEVFASQAGLNRHALEKHYIDNERYKCRHCGRGFAHIYRLEVHIRQEMEAHTARRLAVSAPPQGRSSLVIDNDTAEHVARIKPSERMSFSEKLLIESAKERIRMRNSLMTVFPEDPTSEIPTTSSTARKEAQKAVKKRHFCSTCGKGFSRPVFVRRHMDIHLRNVQPFICSVCGKSLSSREMLQRHMINIHQRPRQSQQFSSQDNSKNLMELCLKCHICHRIMSSKRALKLHLAVHTGVKPFACSVCSFRFRSTGQLNQHFQTKHADKIASENVVNPTTVAEPQESSSTLCCLQCQKVFSDARLLANHLCTVTPVELQRFCFLCHKHFKSPQTLRLHMRLHKKSATAQLHCAQCDKTFLYATSYRRHMRQHEQPRSWKCVQCGALFTERANLRTHVATVHTKEINLDERAPV